MKRRLIAMIAMIVIMSPRAALPMELSLFPSAELDELYNSNVNATANNQKGDWITAQLLGGKVDAQSVDRDFFLNYSTVLAEYAGYPDLDRFGRDQFLQLNDTERLSTAATTNISDVFLRGNATSGQFFSDGTQPIAPQLMSALLYDSTTESNGFSANFRYVNNDSFAWTSEVHQSFFSTNSNGSSANSNSANGLSFDQGGSFSVDRLVGERFTVGAGYQFDDFRFTNGAPSSDSHMPMLQLSWGIGTPFSIRAAAGPRITTTSSAVVGNSLFSGSTSVEPGFNVIVNYTGKRFIVQGTASESSGISAGFGGQTNNITVGTLVQYELTRRTRLFANVGYFNFSGAGTNGYSFSYAAGASYRLTRNISLTAEYYGYQTLANGATAGALVASPGQNVGTNVFLIGVVFHPAPWRRSLN